MKRILVIAAALVVAGCAAREPIVKLMPAKGPEIPESLLTCPASPQVPGDGATQADVGRYLLDLYESGQECRGKLGAVRKIIDAEPNI